MGQEKIVVMVCDRCGERLELRGDPKGAEYAENLRAAARWHTLRTSDMGGETEWLLDPLCWTAFHREFLSVSA